MDYRIYWDKLFNNNDTEILILIIYYLYMV